MLDPLLFEGALDSSLLPPPTYLNRCLWKSAAHLWHQSTQIPGAAGGSRCPQSRCGEATEVLTKRPLTTRLSNHKGICGHNMSQRQFDEVDICGIDGFHGVASHRVWIQKVKLKRTHSSAFAFDSFDGNGIRCPVYNELPWPKVLCTSSCRQIFRVLAADVFLQGLVNR